MARAHEVFAIFPQARTDLAGIKDGYTFPENVHVYNPVDTPPPRNVLDLLPARLQRAFRYRWLLRSWRGPAYSTLLNDYHLISEILRRHKIEVVVFDHIETMQSCAPFVRRLSPESVLMLNAHNVDSELYAQQLKSGSLPESNVKLLATYKSALWIETHLADYVDAFWACSDQDRDRLTRMNAGRLKGYAIYNGIAVELLPFASKPNKRSLKRLLFCGALNYQPNRRGLEWFYRAIWPLIRVEDQEIRLSIVGYGAEPKDFSALRADSAVDFIGEVENVVPQYHQTSVSIVPLLEGSGTRVKILEAMALGSPVVSTSIGAEGISLDFGREILLADEPREFAKAVLHLLRDDNVYNDIRHAARRVVEQRFDWRILGSQINRTVDELAKTHPNATTSDSLHI